MPNINDQTRQALAARVQFYRDLGIHSFYRREGAVAAEIVGAAAAEVEARGEVLPVIIHAGSGDKDSALGLIREEIGDCTRCRLSKGRNKIVFGTGDVNAGIMFVGEGPGADEDEQGLPFVGRAGQLLNNMINAMGLKREEVYIANVVKCRPPGNRTPEKDECDTCSPFLMQQIEVVQPKIIVALGAVAAKNLLAMNDSMANLRGRIYDFKNTKLAVTYHPAYLLRDPRQKAEAWKDLQMVMRYLGMTPPAKAAAPAPPQSKND